jgi:phosphopantothenoylcysteine decarboxylase / phosphopantothenate---cysteine ligase
MSRIALGVTGGIGAYKAVEVARGLQKQGHEVSAVMTAAACRFVGPLTFEAITRRRVISAPFEPAANVDVEHVSLASSIDLLLVAPATANIIGKFAAGIADDFLSTLYLATTAPVVVAPSMNTAMLEHEAVRRNLEVLVARGVHVVEPGSGSLACGWIGKGRLAEPEEIVAAVERVLHPAGAMTGTRLLVTAGPTCEDLDPVRFIGNRSSGRMGFALAAAATGRGARVTLVIGPTAVEPPSVDEIVRVRTAAEMHEAVVSRAAAMDAIVMAAAVADYRPQRREPEKIKKGAEPLTLTLVRTRDILADLGRKKGAGARPVLVGFAAETGDPVAETRRKRREKNVDLMVANDVSRPDAGFESENNAVTIVGADGEDTLPLQPKTAIAQKILDRVEALLKAPAAESV